MAEVLSIQIGADVSGALRDLPKVTKTLAQVEDQFASLVDSTGDFAKAIDELGKDGALSINFLGKQISDFKQAFANATDPVEIKKFGEALQILKIKQQELINSGIQLKTQHEGSTVATQRLSASVLGLSKAFEILPPELAHLTHGFDQVFQSYERVTHGSETTGEAVKKFAGVLGEVGLGLAIGLAVGLLADFVKGLFEAEKGLGDAGRASEQFTEQIKAQNESIDELKKSIADTNALGKIRLEIQAGQALESLPDKLKALENLKFGLLDLSGVSTENRKLISDLGDEEVKAADRAKEAFKRFTDLASDGVRELVGNVKNVDEALAAIKVKQPFTNKNGVLIDVDATERDKILLEDVKKTSEQLLNIQKQVSAANSAQSLIYGQIEKQRVDIINEANKETKSLLNSRAAIIEEFTKKFAGIKDPFPDFLAKGLPLGKVNDKLLREGLTAAFKLFSDAYRDVISRKVIASDIPVIPTFKLAQVGDSDIVKQIQDKFGDLSKQVADAVDKGIFTIPVDFKTPPEGDGQALKQIEDRFIELAKAVEQFTGQKKAVLNFGFDAAKLDHAKFEEVLQNVQDEVNRFAQGTPLIVSIDADFKVKARVDLKRLAQDLNRELTTVLSQTLQDTVSSIGNAIGDILTNTGTLEDGFKSIFLVISKGLASLGAALIKTGVLALGIKAALDKLAISPGLTIALGVAMVALSKALQNSFSAREKGGPVMEGHEYLVNEKGQEAFKDSRGRISMIPGGIQTFRPPSSGVIIPAALAKIMASQAHIPKLAGGGVVNSPTFALIGESGPEIVAPLSMIPAFNGGRNDQSQRMTTKLRGRDIYLSQSRQGRSNGRLV